MRIIIKNAGGDFTVNIVLAGRDSEADFAGFLQGRLSLHFKTEMLSKGALTIKGAGENALLVHTDSLESCPQNTVFILGKSAVPENFPAIEKSFGCIFWSEQKSHREFLSRTGITAISCGYSHKDFITFSSKEEDACVLSLQRSVKSVSGSIISPFELPARRTSEDDYHLMSYFAVCAALGRF